MGRFKQRKKSSTSDKRDFGMRLYENLKKSVYMIKNLQQSIMIYLGSLWEEDDKPSSDGTLAAARGGTVM